MSAPTMQTPPPPHRGNRWRTIAIAALALNLVLIGAGVGAFSAGVRLTPPGGGGGGGPGGQMSRVMIESLPEARRQELRREIGRSLRDAQGLRRAARDARVAAYKTAMAEPYNPVAVRAAFAQMRAADARVMARFDDAIVDALGKLTPEERRTAMMELAARAHKGRGGHERRGDRPPPPPP
jgi:uncharacterized membrane protein